MDFLSFEKTRYESFDHLPPPHKKKQKTKQKAPFRIQESTGIAFFSIGINVPLHRATWTTEKKGRNPLN